MSTVRQKLFTPGLLVQKSLTFTFDEQKIIPCTKINKKRKKKQNSKNLYGLIRKLHNFYKVDWKIRISKKIKTNSVCKYYWHKNLQGKILKLKEKNNATNSTRKKFFMEDLIKKYKEKIVFCHTLAFLLDIQYFSFDVQQNNRLSFTFDSFISNNLPVFTKTFRCENFIQKQSLFFLKKRGFIGPKFLNQKSYFPSSWHQEKRLEIKRKLEENVFSKIYLALSNKYRDSMV